MSEARAPYESQELAVTYAPTANMVEALALMSDQEFSQKLAAMKLAQKRIAMIQRELMDRDIDYGVIPGTPKPTLLKPGAERLAKFHGLHEEFSETITLGDGVKLPHIRVNMVCRLHLGSLDGPVVAQGFGAANSHEKKHRWREAQRHCPSCGAATIFKSRDGGWFCWAKRGGCGRMFAEGDEAITRQQLGMVENPDPWDAENTLLKMAAKRAYVDAILRATAASGLFTQDVEDQDHAPAAAAAKSAIKDTLAKQPTPTQEGLPQGNHKAPNPELVKLWNEYLAVRRDAIDAGIDDTASLADLRAADTPMSQYRAMIDDIKAQIAEAAL